MKKIVFSALNIIVKKNKLNVRFKINPGASINKLTKQSDGTLKL